MSGGGGGEGSTWVWILVAGVVLCAAGHGIEIGGLELHWQDDGKLNRVETAGLVARFGLTTYFLAIHG